MSIEHPGWLSNLRKGLVIPALPLALHENREWSRRHQQALIRYYIEAGAGGLAVGVHSTQFEIRDPEHGLFEPVLSLASEVMENHADSDFVRIAGICGRTVQAHEEADLAVDLGYHAGLLSLAAFGTKDESEILNHVRSISETIQVIGFYLQPAVGGRIFTYQFWRQFCDIENVIAIKIAPFNRYYTFEVVRAVIESGRRDLTLYTGNDDNIIADLLTSFQWKGETRFIMGGLLGQWGVWTKRAVELLEEIKLARSADHISANWLSRNASLTDANSAVFDSPNGFAGCIPGILEVLRRQGLVPSNHCLNPTEALSPGQAEELDRVSNAYPELTDDDFIRENLDRWLDAKQLRKTIHL